MRKLILLSALAIVLTSCGGNETSSSDNSSTSETPVEKTVLEKFEALLAKFENIGYDANKISYTQTQVDNYSAIDLVSTRVASGTQYNGNFYHEDFEEKIDEGEQYSGVNEKGIYNDNFYSILYYGDGDSNNRLSEYPKGTTDFNDFSNCSFKGYYMNNVLAYCYDNYLAIKDDTRYSKITLTCDSKDVDLSSDGEKTIDFAYRIFSGSNLVNAIVSSDTIKIENGKVISSESDYTFSQMGSTNYRKFVKKATYEYDSSIGDYNGTKLDPADFAKSAS